MLDQITPVLLTCNEEANIGRVLERLTWAKTIIVVDSCSSDRTMNIASSFPMVQFVQHRFVSHAQQWNFAIHETGITTRWVLALDADYVLTSQLLEELKDLQPAPDVTGFRAFFRYCVFGQPLRGTLYPPVTVLFQRKGAYYYQDGHTQRLKISGKTADLKAKIRHDDRKPLSAWLQAQDRYMTLEARSLGMRPWSGLCFADKMRKTIILAPLLVFLYCLLGKGCLLDGWAGIYYTLQRTVAEMILSMKLITKRVK